MTLLRRPATLSLAFLITAFALLSTALAAAFLRLAPVLALAVVLSIALLLGILLLSFAGSLLARRRGVLARGGFARGWKWNGILNGSWSGSGSGTWLGCRTSGHAPATGDATEAARRFIAGWGIGHRRRSRISMGLGFRREFFRARSLNRRR